MAMGGQIRHEHGEHVLKPEGKRLQKPDASVEVGQGLGLLVAEDHAAGALHRLGALSGRA